MKSFFKKIMVKYAIDICSLAVLLTPIASRVCRTFFYEPKQPEGLGKFVADNIKR